MAPLRVKAKNQNLDPIEFTDAQIIFRNFEGKGGDYNTEGNRNFCLLLDENLAKDLEKEGWNIRYPIQRDPDDDLRPYTQIRVAFRNRDGSIKPRPPRVVLVTSRNKKVLTEKNIAMLDYAEIEYIDLIVNPSFWEVNNKHGIKGYVKTMFVTIKEDPLEMKYSDVPEAEALDDDI